MATFGRLGEVATVPLELSAGSSLTLRARGLVKSRLYMAEIDIGEHGLAQNDEYPQWDDVFTVGIRYREEVSETLVYGQRFDFKAPVGFSHILYLPEVDFVEFSSERHSVEILLPRAFMRQIAEDLEVPAITHLGNDACLLAFDPVLVSLANRIHPYLDDPNMLDTLYADSFMWSFGIYVMSRYGDLASRRSSVGGLTTWQERLAKELIEINLTDGIALEELARCCDLRVSQFAHAFKHSVGVPPHQWLINRRVSRAIDLLRGRSFNLTEIAGQCGFADQAHFSRVFRKRVGVAPAAWRKQI